MRKDGLVEDETENLPHVIVEDLIELVCSGLPFLEEPCIVESFQQQLSLALLRPPRV